MTSGVVVAHKVGVLLGRWAGYRGESGFTLLYTAVAFWLIGVYSVNGQKQKYVYPICLCIHSTTPQCMALSLNRPSHFKLPK